MHAIQQAHLGINSRSIKLPASEVPPLGSFAKGLRSANAAVTVSDSLQYQSSPTLYKCYRQRASHNICILPDASLHALPLRYIPQSEDHCYLKS